MLILISDSKSNQSDSTNHTPTNETQKKTTTATTSTATPAITCNFSTNTPPNTNMAKTPSQINLTTNNLGDFRFSTFLPTIYPKCHELI